MYLYHYFDKTIGAFVNLSEIPIEEANSVLILDIIIIVGFITRIFSVRQGGGRRQCGGIVD